MSASGGYYSYADRAIKALERIATAAEVLAGLHQHPAGTFEDGCSTCAACRKATPGPHCLGTGAHE